MVAASVMPVAVVRFRPINALLAPFAPAWLVTTVQVVLDDPPEALALVSEGAVPVIPLVTRVKLPVVTPDTGSENVTVHDNGPVFTVCDAPARTIELTVGLVVS